MARCWLPDKVAETMKAEEQFDAYMAALQEWEKSKRDADFTKWQNEQGGKTKKKGGQSAKSLTAGHTQMTRLELLQGYFWPLPVYMRVKGQKPDKATHPVIAMPYQGKVIKGVLLDESHGRPVGTFAIYGEDTRFIKKDCWRFL